MRGLVVRGHEPGEPPALVKGGVHQVLVLAGGLAVDRAVGTHDRGSLGLLCRGPERGQVDLVQRPRAHDRVVRRGVAVRLLVVHREVLHLRHLALALHPVDIRGRHGRVQVRVLGVGLERPPPARVAVDVHRRAQVDHGPLAPLLRPDDLPVLGGQRRVEGGRQGYSGGHLRHAGEAVTHADRAVLLADGRDAQAGDRRDVEHVRLAEPGPGHHVDLVREGHLSQQHLDPLVYRERLVKPRAGRAGRRCRGAGRAPEAPATVAAKAVSGSVSTSANASAASAAIRRIRRRLAPGIGFITASDSSSQRDHACA